MNGAIGLYLRQIRSFTTVDGAALGYTWKIMIYVCNFIHVMIHVFKFIQVMIYVCIFINVMNYVYKFIQVMIYVYK